MRAAAVALCAVALVGCGVGSGSSPNAPVALTVTRDFGTTTLLELPAGRADTAVRLLSRSATVELGRGGRVEAIDGVSSGPASDWVVYVNGIHAGDEAGDVHGGDRVWWDLRDRGADVRAVAGSFPEPFVHGTGGRRLPVRVECADPGSPPCEAVADKLLALKVPIGRSNLSRSAADESLRILVGPWSKLRGRDAESVAIDRGPRASGVFARFDASGDELVVLDARGRPARTLGAGSGLIAATRSRERQPVWFVTGTDDGGVASAARALDEGALSNRYALAISADLPVAVPAG